MVKAAEDYAERLEREQTRAARQHPPPHTDVIDPEQHKKKKPMSKERTVQVEKKASMRNIIEDIIKGAKDNSFGRPVHIQNDTPDWTPLDIAKTAGALQALSEQGYSVKQAAEYLGLTEKQVQVIVATVR
jgi:hypothetical protein